MFNSAIQTRGIRVCQQTYCVGQLNWRWRPLELRAVQIMKVRWNTKNVWDCVWPANLMSVARNFNVWATQISGVFIKIGSGLMYRNFYYVSNQQNCTTAQWLVCLQYVDLYQFTLSPALFSVAMLPTQFLCETAAFEPSPHTIIKYVMPP